MKWIKYSRYTGEDLGIGAEDLLQALSDFLLESGFNTQYMPFSEWNQHTLEDLKQAIQQALEQGKLFDRGALQEMMERLGKMTPGADGQAARQAWSRRWWTKGRSPSRTRLTRRRRRRGRPEGYQGQVRSHRQIARFPGLQDPQGPAGLARQEQLRPPRYARPGHRHRSQRLLQALRVRRHAEPGRQRDAVLRHPARRRQGAAQPGLLGPARPPVRVPELLRHRADAGLQPQHDPLRRGPLHARPRRWRWRWRT